MWEAVPERVRSYIYSNELPLHVAHIDTTEYELPHREVRVAGIARREPGETLFVRSAKPHREWELPGGRLEPGETPRAAVKREFKEETGYEAIDATPVLAMVWAFPDSTIIQLVHTITHGEKVSDPTSEIEEVGWFTDLPADISFGDDGHTTYEFIVNSELVRVHVDDDDMFTGKLSPGQLRENPIAVAGVAGGAAITIGLARKLLARRDTTEPTTSSKSSPSE